jgi:hypothetical protein
MPSHRNATFLCSLCLISAAWTSADNYPRDHMPINRHLPPASIRSLLIASMLVLGTSILAWWAVRAIRAATAHQPVSTRTAVPAAAAITPPQAQMPASALAPARMPAAIHHDDPPALARFLDRQASDRLAGDFAIQVPAISDPDAQAAVRRLLRDRREALPLRNEAANLLRRSGDARLDAELTAILADDVELEDMRSYAAQHLGVSLIDSKDPGDRRQLADLLAATLNDRHRAVRREALLALVVSDDRRGLDEIATGLTNPRWREDRDLIIRCHFELGHRDAAPVIRPFADDGDDDVRIAALYVLGQWRDDESRSAFERALASPTERVKRAGALALATLTAAPLPRAAEPMDPAALWLRVRTWWEQRRDPLPN